MNLFSWEEYWDTSLRNYHHANSFTVFGASQQRAEKQHCPIWRAEPSCQCCSLVPCRALEGSRQSSLCPPSARQSRAGEAPQTPHQENSSRRTTPNAPWAPLPQEISEACPSKTFIKSKLIWCQLHTENKQERKSKTQNISLWSLVLNNPR